MSAEQKLMLLQNCPNYGQNMPQVRQHLNDFLTRNAAVEVAIVGISVGGQGKYNSI
jgi:hypothetical protein